MSKLSPREKRQDAGVLKVTVCTQGTHPDLSRFVLMLEGPPEWHALQNYVEEGQWTGWRGRYSSLAPDVCVAYARCDEPWSIQQVRERWS